MLKKAMLIISFVLVTYILVCVLLFTLQEKIIFLPDKLDKAHQFSFSLPFEEINIRTDDNKLLHGLLFKTDSARGLIFYLHGNGGSINAWGEVADTYARLHYDIFLLDYRGYGKSEGTIENEDQLFRDVQHAYNEMLNRYKEDDIIVLGYSIGTGLATQLASTNTPKLLILQAPYFSLTDVMRRTYPFIPTFLLKYKLETCRYIAECKMPIILFHGDADEVIAYDSSVKLKALLKPSDTLITIAGQGHNGMTYHPQYVKAMSMILKTE